MIIDIRISVNVKYIKGCCFLYIWKLVHNFIEIGFFHGMFWVSLLWILAWKSTLVIIKSLYFTASSKIWCTGSQCKSRSTTCRIFWTLWKKFQLSEDRNKDKRWWRILSERWYSEMYGKWLQTLYVVYRRSTDKR